VTASGHPVGRNRKIPSATRPETVDLGRIAAQSGKQEALSRRECVSAFCLEIRFTILVDTPPG
jgi:hypothetical protein